MTHSICKSGLKAGLLGAIALATLTPAALASSVAISTDRVQVQVGNNGQVYIRTLADAPNGGVSRVIPATLPRPVATFAPGCTARSHSAHSTRSTAGGVVYSENRSTTRVCQ
jgi:hypothetical protein